MKKILFIPIIVLIVIGGSYLFLNGKTAVLPVPAESELLESEEGIADIIDSEDVALQSEQEARLNKVNENTGEDSRSGFQIMVSNYEGGKIDVATIMSELPGLAINKAVNAIIGKEARGVAFESN